MDSKTMANSRTLSFSSMSSTETDLKPWSHSLDESALVAPSTLLFQGLYIVDDSCRSQPVYRLDRDVAVVPQRFTSVKVERLETSDQPSSSDEEQPAAAYRHLFYLAHPLGAKYQTERPEYYITCAPPTATERSSAGWSGEGQSLGNIALSAEKIQPRWSAKTAYKAWLSPGTNMASQPLFDEHGIGTNIDNAGEYSSRTSVPLFEAIETKTSTVWTMPSRLPAQQQATSSSSAGAGFSRNATLPGEVAREDIGTDRAEAIARGRSSSSSVRGKNGAVSYPKLTISVPLEQAERDALVATWILRLWCDILENPAAKKAALEQLTDPEDLRYRTGSFLSRGLVGAGAIVALGGGGAA
ncbi:hypothetical protein Micbo1qcDRAFT_202075 [Microdochium bolleyi]|uniref:Uncharacterized protein n=1 Tax=Microdochium bolleyi TaxID=196109 RepID=A0A136JAI6_9PEZI|nr:hypothetical protein Micbo1qcDRAFT_202075 [Microdochium bolleyi]